jgi:dodecin
VACQFTEDDLKDIHNGQAELSRVRPKFHPSFSMEVQMTDSVSKVVTLVGTSTESWEKAAKAAVDAASHSLRELRIAEVIKQDMVITDGKVEAYRTKIRVSFKYEGNE